MTVYLVPEDPAFEVLDFDVTVSENHSETSTPTAFPLETGGTVADHVIHEPTIFSCVVEISETPLYYGLNNRANTTEASGVESRYVEGAVVQTPVLLRGNGRLDQTKSFVAEMHDKLTALRVQAIELRVVTTTREYDNMIITSVELPRESLTIGRGRFSLSFQQIETVTSSTVDAPNPAEPRGAALKAKGAQAQTELPTGDAAKAASKSMAYQLGEAGLEAGLNLVKGLGQ